MKKGDVGDKMYVVIQGKLGVYFTSDLDKIKDQPPAAIIHEF